MKKILLALSAVAALTGSASAADLAARPYTKAPPPIVAPSWTGFYIFGGAGGGIWDADTHTNVAGVPATIDQRVGGDGWFGTVGLGYDWQFNGNWVAGVFKSVTNLVAGAFNKPRNLALSTSIDGKSARVINSAFSSR